jgi:hypothetical protein
LDASNPAAIAAAGRSLRQSISTHGRCAARADFSGEATIVSFRNPPENSHKESAAQAIERLRDVFESRLASRRKFLTGPLAGQSPSSSQAPEGPESQVGPDGEVCRATAVGDLLTSPQMQSSIPEAIAASKQASLPEMEPKIRDEESSVSLAALGEEIKDTEEQRLQVPAKMRPAESNRYPGVERRGSVRYKVKGIYVLFGWRQGESGVSTGSVGTVSDGAANPPSDVELAARGPGGAGPEGVRDPESASLSADFDQHEARVHDVSQTGICLIVDRLPPNNRDLWIGVKETWPISWSRVVLRSISEPLPGRFMLHLSFKESCPYDLFKLALMQNLDALAET